MEIARALLPRVWVGAHDEEKKASGAALKKIWKRKYGRSEVVRSLGETVGAANPRLGVMTEVVTIPCGQEFKMGFKSDAKNDAK